MNLRCLSLPPPTTHTHTPLLAAYFIPTIGIKAGLITPFIYWICGQLCQLLSVLPRLALCSSMARTIRIGRFAWKPTWRSGVFVYQRSLRIELSTFPALLWLTRRGRDSSRMTWLSIFFSRVWALLSWIWCKILWICLITSRQPRKMVLRQPQHLERSRFYGFFFSRVLWILWVHESLLEEVVLRQPQQSWISSRGCGSLVRLRFSSPYSLILNW